MAIASTPVQCFIAALAAAGAWLAGPATGAVAPAQELAQLSLEQLANIEITSVSGRAEQLSDVPASVYVITGDDIRRSGATTLPEVLRLAPNLEVARVTASSYAISARGMNNADNKLLVLVDGRIVYTPLYSGVLWYTQDIMLEDVDRIEVISGPGGTLWGSNAVNGVINVVTKSAGQTQGTLVSVGSGSQDQVAGARYGGELGSGKFRLYARGIDQRQMYRTNDAPAGDGRDRWQAGFRVDWDSGITLQGDVYNGHADQRNRDRSAFSGVNLLSSWKTKLADGGALHALAYFDRTELDVPAVPGVTPFSEQLDVVDVEFQHDLAERAQHRISWGGGYRHAADRLVNSNALAFLPDDRNLHWASAFVQDQVALARSIDLTAGVKLEHNAYTGLETMPSLRLAWKPEGKGLVWSEVSRAVRTPSRLDRDLYSPSTPPFLIAGGPDFRSETADVVELGYRAEPSGAVSYSVTAFAHRYRHLRSVELIDRRFFEVANQMEGTGHGVEAWATWQATPHWRLSAGGVYLKQHLRLRPDSTDPTGVSAAGNDPTVQWTLRSSFDLPGDTSLDVDIRHVGELPAPLVPAYTAVNLRLGWRVRPNVELSVVGQNLFDPGHVEFGSPASASVIPRAVFFKITYAL